MVLFPNKMYDSLKIIALVVLPVLGVLYYVLSKIGHLPSVNTVLGCIFVANAILGIVLHWSAKGYARSDVRFDGQMDVHELGDKKVVQMAFKDENQLETLTDKKEVRFKVNQLD